jgi:hypothetical protein
MTIRPLLALSSATLVFAQYANGVDPRPSVADYRAHIGNGSVSLGAVFLSASEQRKSLERDWSHAYFIVEAVLYPEPGIQLTVAPRDFMLRVGTETVAPVDAEVMAPYPRTHNGPVAPDSKVHVQTVDTVGVASGPNGRKTVYAGSEVQVAAGNYPTAPPPAQPDPRFETRRALTEKELPDAKTSRPIAGYLYFPKPKNPGKNAAYELDYYGDSGQLKLVIEPEKKTTP